MEINGFEYIPKEQRKNILLLADDLRLSSGVGTVSRTFVTGIAHRYNWFQLGAAVQHPDIGKRIDISQDLNNRLNLPDTSVLIQPHNGYGDPDIVRALLREFKFDAILHFTDPRQWLWLYNMEHELRQDIPIFFYHVWDNLPYPMYNKSYYLSCDWIGCISKQTKNIVENVCYKDLLEPWQVTYVPHGIDKKIFVPLSEEEPGQMREDKDKNMKHDYDMMKDYRKRLFGDKEINFVVLYNNRNIRRKNMGDVILAFKTFCETLSKEQADKCMLLMHTQAVDPNGTDLHAVKDAVASGINIFIHEEKLDPDSLNYLYNIADVTINLASAEGFGLATAESIMAGTPIIATVTGGLQDQMGFKDKDGKYIQFDREWGTNADGKVKGTNGKWVYPLFPTGRSLVGSPPTPYIFDDRATWEEAAIALKYWYELPNEEREVCGQAGREFMLQEEVGMDADFMNKRFMSDMEIAWEKWQPRERYHIIKV